MRQLQCCFGVALMLSSMSSVAFAQNADASIMPLADVRPGMKGYGYSVFSGSVPERFEFLVRGIVPNFQVAENLVWPDIITVRVSGGPLQPDGSHLFDRNSIFGGMSGSPMFIDGRIIGGLAVAPDFSTAVQAGVTPIEYQLRMGLLKHPGATTRTTVEPGDYVGVCFVYGDSDRCIHSTVTIVREGHIFTTAHSIGIPFGNISLPVFRVPVADLMQTQQGASKLAAKREAPIGTAIIHGQFGFVVHGGALPETVPVSLIIDGIYDESRRYEYHMAYHKSGTGGLRQIIENTVNALPVDPIASALDVAVYLSNPAGEIRYSDGLNVAVSSLEQLLDYLIDQEQEGLHINRIELRYHKQKNPYLWRPLVIKVDQKGGGGNVVVLARCDRDNITEQFSEAIDIRPLKKFRGSHTEWLDGTSLQTAILALMPVRDALPLLAQMQNRDALYYVALERNDSISIQSGAKNGVGIRKPKVDILLSKTFGSHRFYVEDATKVRLTSQ